MKTIKYFLAVAVLLAVAIFPTISLGAGSAGIIISPSSGSFKSGQTFNVAISVNPGSEKIDMVRAKLTFSSDLLEIKNFATSPTFSYQAGSNSFDNSAGTFSWGAGTPGGITSPVVFGTITFGVKKAGSATISTSVDSLALTAGENKFNGQLSSSAFNLSAVLPAKPVAQKITETQASAQPLEQSAGDINDAVDTQIIQKQQPKNFAAGLANATPFSLTIRVLSIAGIILIVLLLGFTIFKIIKKPVSNISKKKF